MSEVQKQNLMKHVSWMEEHCEKCKMQVPSEVLVVKECLGRGEMPSNEAGKKAFMCIHKAKASGRNL